MLSLAEQLKNEQSLLVFGRGYNYATALEAALKVRPDIPACILDIATFWVQAPLCLFSLAK